MAEWGATVYAKRNGRHLAYRVSDGDGPTVVGLMPGFEPLSSIGDHFARPVFDRVRDFGKSVLAERLGVGASDPIDPAEPPGLDDVADDLIAVMDHENIGAAVLWGFYTAGTVAIRVAARHPERVSQLALINSFLCWEDASDLEGVDTYYRRMWSDEVEHGPNEEINILSIVAPSMSNNSAFREWWADVGRQGASPSSALAMGRADSAWDVRADLASVRAPTLVVHRRDNRFVPVSHARYAAELIDSSTLVEVPGIDFMGFIDSDALFDPVEEFVTSRAPRRRRTLAAVLFTDLVDSTRRAAAEGDRAWARLIAEHDAIVAEVVAAHDGEVVKSTGDGALAVFTGPAAAIAAAKTLNTRLRARDLQVRSGIHAGEIERIGEDITGLAVTIAARVMAYADAGEVLVSNAVPPLVAGSGIEFETRQEVELKGVPGTWTLLSPK